MIEEKKGFHLDYRFSLTRENVRDLDLGNRSATERITTFTCMCSK